MLTNHPQRHVRDRDRVREKEYTQNPWIKAPIIICLSIKHCADYLTTTKSCTRKTQGLNVNEEVLYRFKESFQRNTQMIV